MNGQPWTVSEKERLSELRARGLTSTAIAAELGRPIGSVCWMAKELRLEPKKNGFHRIFLNNKVIYFKLPLSPGVEKLLRRIDRLIEWVDEGRDNYELARAFHVRNPDVAYVVRRLGLLRPHEEEVAPESDLVKRCCLSCRCVAELSRFRFRCDACLEAAGGDDPEYIIGGLHEYPSL